MKMLQNEEEDFSLMGLDVFWRKRTKKIQAKLKEYGMFIVVGKNHYITLTMRLLRLV